MITLEVRKFCKDCPHFEVKTIREVNEVRYITCEHLEKCAAAYEKGQEAGPETFADLYIHE